MEGTTPFYYSRGVCEGENIKKQMINKIENTCSMKVRNDHVILAPPSFLKQTTLCLEVEGSGSEEWYVKSVSRSTEGVTGTQTHYCR